MQEVYRLIEKAGGRAVMTRADHVSGSDRIYDTELALDADNRMIGLRCKVLGD